MVCKQVLAGLRVFPSPQYVIDKIVMHVYEDPGHEQEYSAAKRTLAKFDVGLEIVRQGKKSDIPK